MKLKKVGWLQSFKKIEIESILKTENDLLRKKLDEVLGIALEQYLGRPFDIQKDADRVKCNILIGTNKTDYYIDDKLIGTMNCLYGLNEDDFIRNKISLQITFTPAM